MTTPESCVLSRARAATLFHNNAMDRFSMASKDLLRVVSLNLRDNEGGV